MRRDDHDQHDDDAAHTHLPEMEVRVRALTSLLEAKGLVDPKALDELVTLYEDEVGPQNGAKVVARAWTDPAYAERLFTDATAAIAELGFGGRQGEHMVAVANTPEVHNMVVCTLCSCYPWPVLGLPPNWYKSPAYRAKAVADPRGVLADFGVSVPEGPRSGSGIQRRRCVIWSCRCVRRGPKAGARRSLPASSPAIA